MLKFKENTRLHPLAVTAIHSSFVNTLFTLQRLLDPALVFGLIPILGWYYKVVLTNDFIFLGIISGLLVIPVFKTIGRYRPSHTADAAREGQRILAGWTIVLGLLLFLGYSTKTSAIFSRRLVLTWFLLVPVVLYGSHLCVLAIRHYLLQAGHTNRRAVIIGMGEAAQYLAEQLQTSHYLGVKLLGCFVKESEVPPPNSRELPLDAPDLPMTWIKKKQRLEPDQPNPTLPILGNGSDVEAYIRDNFVDCVYITPPIADSELTELITKLQDLPTAVYVVPNIWRLNLLRSKVHRVNGISMIALWETPLYDLQYDLKRLLDILLSLIGLIVLAPLLVLIGVTVKLSSPGPILFKQRRYGLNGQDIVIYKFRTMSVMEDGETIRQAQRHDKRITKVGHILRRTSLDELPQLINVLQGRMSIVGPRPHAVAHNELYRTQIDGYMLRHKVKPGITGWAQVHGFRGETDTLEKMQQRIQYDLDYINRWSLWLDLQIIMQTILVVFARRNAY
jgi:putative colanic acid biosysnthesis UDP-glucose lipid carrier transferase